MPGTLASALTAAFACNPSLDRIAAELVAARVAPDAALGWAARTDDGRWVEGAGRASVDERGLDEPIFDLASLTKPLTAFAVARSSALACASLLGDVLEEARGTASAEIPIELLLAHRAGLEAHLPLYEPRVRGERFDRALAMRRAADARRPGLAEAPSASGFAPVYSDLGFALVGEALARAEGGIDAGEIIERHVAVALGRDDLGTARTLARARIDFERRVRPTETVPWRGGAISGAVHDENAWALTGTGGSGHAGLFGTVSSVLAFGRAALDAIARGEGPLRSPGGADLGWLVEPRPGGTLRAGFDGRSETGSSAGSVAGPRTFGHLGFTGTSVWIDPDAEAVVVLLTNRVCPTRDNVAIRTARPIVHDTLFALARAGRACSAPRVE